MTVKERNPSVYNPTLPRNPGSKLDPKQSCREQAWHEKFLFGFSGTRKFVTSGIGFDRCKPIPCFAIEVSCMPFTQITFQRQRKGSIMHTIQGVHEVDPVPFIAVRVVSTS